MVSHSSPSWHDYGVHSTGKPVSEFIVHTQYSLSCKGNDAQGERASEGEIERGREREGGREGERQREREQL